MDGWMQAACYMPPPKRPKSDVRWTTMCAEVESRLPERNCGDVDDNFDVTVVNEHDVDDYTAATFYSHSSAPSTELVPAVSCDLPLDLRSADDLHDASDVTGSRQPTRSMTLRRLLLKPLTPPSDSCRPLSTTSSPPSASPVAAATHRECRTTAAYVAEGPARCRTSLNAGGLCTQPAALPSAAARAPQTDIGSSRNPPSAALRPVVLNDDDTDDGRKHSQQPLTTKHQSRDCLVVVGLPRSPSGLNRSSGSVASAVARTLPQPPASLCDNRRLQTTSSLSSKYSRLTGRLQSRDSHSSGEASKSIDTIETSNSLK